MDDSEILKELLKRGLMVSPQTLTEIKRNGMEQFLSGEGRGRIGKQDAGERHKITYQIKEYPHQDVITPEDVIRRNLEKYEILRRILLKRADAVSIGNIQKTSSKACIVGMVREKTQGGFLLEDATGQASVKSRENVEEDDVIAVRGWPRDNTFFAEEIIYPDVPINREITSMDARILLTSGMNAHEGGFDVVIMPDSLAGEGKERRIPNPAWIFLEDGKNNMVVLVYRVSGRTDKNTVISWLRKRHIGKRRHIPERGTVLERIPDLFWVISESEPWMDNYKGVSIVSFGRNHSAIIDLKTRKIETR
jgi:hypothetical protein